MKNTYTISPKETKYNGIIFRSRLEAQWACFFDLIGWEWEYEPFDLNGWTPDFKLIGTERDVLIEVKPSFMVAETINRLINILNLKENKYEYWEHTPIILTEDFLFIHKTTDYTCFGIDLNNDGISFKDNQTRDNVFDFASQQMIWTGWLFGDYDTRKNFVYDTETMNYLISLWKLSKNRVRFTYQDNQYHNPTINIVKECESLNKSSNQYMKNNNFESSDLTNLIIGMKVEHPKFGFGKVVSLEKFSNDRKVVVVFENYGEKTLLEKHTKLKIPPLFASSQTAHYLETCK